MVLLFLGSIFFACENEDPTPLPDTETSTDQEVGITLDQVTIDAFKNDPEALELGQLLEQNTDLILNAMRQQGITSQELSALMDAGDETQLQYALKLDPAVVHENAVKIQTLSQSLLSKYPGLQALSESTEGYRNPYQAMDLALAGSADKCEWYDWRNLGKYTVCVAACAVTAPTGFGYVLCCAVCYLSFCT